MAIFLLLNSGWVYSVFNDSDNSIALNSTVDGAVFNEKEYMGVLWIEKVTDGRLIFADDYRQLLLFSIFGKENIRAFLGSTTQSSSIGYTFVGSSNIRSGLFTNRRNQGIMLLDPFEQHLNIIYDAGGSRFMINK